METVDNPAATTKDVEQSQQLETKYEDTSLFSTNKLNYGAKLSIKGEEDQPEYIIANSDSLTAALQAAEKKIEEQISTNLLLTEKLESGSQYLSKMQAEHVQEVARKDHSINYTQKLNVNLSDEMSQTETSSAEITSRYKSLVSTLEQQLEDVKKEVSASSCSDLGRNVGHVSTGNFLMCQKVEVSAVPSSQIFSNDCCLC